MRCGLIFMFSLCLFVFSTTQSVPVSRYETTMKVDMVYKSLILKNTIVRMVGGSLPVMIDLGRCELPEYIVGMEFQIEQTVYDDYSQKFKPTDNTYLRLSSYCVGAHG